MPDSFLQALSVIEREQFWHDLITSGEKVIVIEDKSHILGFASICAYRDCVAKTTEGEISAIYLHPEYWHRGFGTRLCQSVFLN